MARKNDMKFFEIKTYDVEINAKNRTPDSVRTAIENICGYEPRTIAKYADENEAESLVSDGIAAGMYYQCD